MGSFGLVNHWGLAEMHGQMWEWCGDQWQPDPSGEGWPSDGRPWQGFKPTQEVPGPIQMYKRLLRGGSWNDNPRFCRSACRFGSHPDRCDNNVGFRVCCLPQGHILYPLTL